MSFSAPRYQLSVVSAVLCAFLCLLIDSLAHTHTTNVKQQTQSSISILAVRLAVSLFFSFSHAISCMCVLFATFLIYTLIYVRKRKKSEHGQTKRRCLAVIRFTFLGESNSIYENIADPIQLQNPIQLHFEANE